MSRIPPERMAAALRQAETISPEDHAKVKAPAEIVRPLRSEIHKTPDDHGMTAWTDPRTTARRWRPGTSRPRAARATGW